MSSLSCTENFGLAVHKQKQETEDK